MLFKMSTFHATLTQRIAQSVTCLATEASLTADPGVASSIPAWSHTFVEIDHEIISTAIHVSNSHTKFGWISSNGLGGDSMTDGRKYPTNPRKP